MHTSHYGFRSLKTEDSPQQERKYVGIIHNVGRKTGETGLVRHVSAPQKGAQSHLVTVS